MVSGAKWTKELTTEFIALYEANECLWRKESQNYRKEAERSRAYAELVHFLHARGMREITTKEVKAKIHNMRNGIRKTKAKMSKAQQAGNANTYVPTLWYYDLFAFICDADPSPESVKNHGEEACYVAMSHTRANMDDALPTDTTSGVGEQSKAASIPDAESTTEGQGAQSSTLPTGRVAEPQDESDLGSKLRKMAPDQAGYAEVLLHRICEMGLSGQLNASVDIGQAIQNSALLPAEHMSPIPLSRPPLASKIDADALLQEATDSHRRVQVVQDISFKEALEDLCKLTENDENNGPPDGDIANINLYPLTPASPSSRATADGPPYHPTSLASLFRMPPAGVASQSLLAQPFVPVEVGLDVLNSGGMEGPDQAMMPTSNDPAAIVHNDEYEDVSSVSHASRAENDAASCASRSSLGSRAEDFDNECGSNNFREMLKRVPSNYRKAMRSDTSKGLLLNYCLFRFDRRYLQGKKFEYGELYAEWPPRFQTIVDDVCEKTSHTRCICRDSLLQNVSPRNPKRTLDDYETDPRRSSPSSRSPSKKMKLPEITNDAESNEGESSRSQRRMYDEDGADDEEPEMARQQTLHASSPPQHQFSFSHLGSNRSATPPPRRHEPPGPRSLSSPSSMPGPSSMPPPPSPTPGTTPRPAPSSSPAPSVIPPPAVHRKIRFADEIEYRIPAKSIKEKLTPQYLKKIVFADMLKHEENLLVMLLNAANESMCTGGTTTNTCTLMTAMCSFQAEIKKQMPRIAVMPSITLLQRIQWLLYHFQNGTVPPNYRVELSAYKTEIVQRFRDEQRRIWIEKENMGHDISEEMRTSWPPIMEKIYNEHFENPRRTEHGIDNDPSDNVYSALLNIMARGDVQNVVKEAQIISDKASFYETGPHDRNLYKSVVFIEICSELEKDREQY